MFLDVREAAELINQGRLLHIAGDESLLKMLPAGNWIGGTTPYFITNGGAASAKDRLFVNEIKGALDFRIQTYTAGDIESIVKNAFTSGLTFLVLPYESEAAAVYSKRAPYIDNLYMTPVIGWVSGFDLHVRGQALTFDGTGHAYCDRAAALHIKLPENRIANIKTINIFHPDPLGDTLEFYEDTYAVERCRINGLDASFADYIAENGINSKLPLTADYNGVNINVSIRSVDRQSGVVRLFAPVFAGVRYRLAKNVDDYEAQFKAEMKNEENAKPVFSCNCICNYLYGNLAGKKTPPFEGPVTFGEIAYQVLNQTLVFVEY